MEQKIFERKMKELMDDKKKILDSIFISQEKAKQIKEYQAKVNEVDLIIKCAELSTKLDKVVELLGNILRDYDPKGENKQLQDVFTEFYSQLDEFESKKHLEKLHNVLNKNRVVNADSSQQ